MIRDRPCPALRHHKKLDAADVAFKVRGVRRTRYFGPSRTRSAAVKYAAWCRRWPWQLQVVHNPGIWPAVRMDTFGEKTQSLAVWARGVGISESAMRYRLDALGWDVERAVTTPKIAPHFARAG